MNSMIAWARYRAPHSLRNSDNLTLLEDMQEFLYNKYLMKYCKVDANAIRNLSLLEIASMPSNEQYITLLSHIFTVGIQNVPADRMMIFIDWMIHDPEFETDLIIYIWMNSVLNSMMHYPVHSDCILVAMQGCSGYTLNFLWDIAKYSDQFTIKVVETIAQYSESDEYLKAIAYLYVCSGCESWMLVNFFKTVSLLRGDDLIKFTDAFVTYTWTLQDLETLLDKGYSAKKLFKPLTTCTNTSFILSGRRFPVDSLKKHALSVRKPDPSAADMVLPKVPNGYKLNYYMWSTAYSPNMRTFDNLVKNKYEEWFENLTREQLIHLQRVNPVAFTACRNKEFSYVTDTLDAIMHYI